MSESFSASSFQCDQLQQRAATEVEQLIAAFPIVVNTATSVDLNVYREKCRDALQHVLAEHEIFATKITVDETHGWQQTIGETLLLNELKSADVAASIDDNLIAQLADNQGVTWWLQAKADEQCMRLWLAAPMTIADRFTLTRIADETLQIVNQPELLDAEPAESIQYIDACEWLAEQRSDGVSSWLRFYQAVPFNSPYLHSPKTAQPSSAALDHFIDLPQAASTLVHLGAKLDDIGLTAAHLPLVTAQLWAMYHMWSGNSDALILDYHADIREQFEDLQAVAGPLSNDLPFALSVTTDASLAVWLQRNIDDCQQKLTAQLDFNASELLPQGYQASAIRFEQQVTYGATCAEFYSDNRLAASDTHSECHDHAVIALVFGEQSLQLRATASHIDKATLQHLASQFADWLNRVATDIDWTMAVNELPRLGASAEQLLVSNALSESLPDYSAQTVDQRLRHFAASQPQSTAISYTDDAGNPLAFTYAEFEQKTAQFANFLLEVGADSDGSRVGIMLDRRVDAMVAMVASARLGVAYCPIDVQVPSNRLVNMVNDAQITVLVTGMDYLDRVMSDELASLELIVLERDAEEIEELGDTLEATHTQADDEAYIIYTSGTTGEPKGVPISHAAIDHYAQSVVARLQLPANSRLSALSTMAADLGYTAIFGALLTGRTLVVIPESCQLDADALAQQLQRTPVDCLKIVPSHLSALLTSENPDVLPLDCLVLGGEASALSMLMQAQTLRPELRLFNHYGPTEATVGVICDAIVLNENSETALSTLGRGLADVDCWVMTPDQQLVAPGAIGELCFGGPTLSAGYLGKPELTNERFVNNPYTQQPVYRSGDLVRLRLDGQLQFLGRNDDQIKVRGFRVELEDIRQQLVDLPNVDNAAVLFHDNELHAYVAGSSLDKALIQTQAEQRLSHYMHPHHWVWLTQLPVTSNGKIDRQALREMAQTEAASTYVAPETELQQQLADLWLQLLPSHSIGIEDNFFRLGGDSIITIQLVARARQRGIHFTPQQVFSAPTIRELSAVATEMALIDADQTQLVGSVPLSAVQKRLLQRSLVASDTGGDAASAERALQNCADYVRVRVLDVAQDFDSAILSRVVDYLLQKHDSLRMRFSVEDGAIVQQAVHSEALDLTAHWQTQAHKSMCADELDAVIRQDVAAQQFDLGNGPLISFTLYQGQTQTRLLIMAHYLVMDGVSWRILIQDLVDQYLHVRTYGQLNTLQKTSSLRQWQSYWAEQAELAPFQQRVEQAKQVLEACEQASLYTQQALEDKASRNTEATCEHRLATLSEAATQQLLSATPDTLKTPIESLLLATMLSSFSASGLAENTAKLPVFIERHVRDLAPQPLDFSETTGWFASVEPVVLAADTEVTQTICYVKQALRAQADLHSVHFDSATLTPQMRETQSNSGSTETVAPAGGIFFTYLGQIEQPLNAEQLGLRYSDCVIEPKRHSAHLRDYLFEISCVVYQGKLHLDVIYSSALHDNATIAQWLAQWQATLETLNQQSADIAPRVLQAGDFHPQLSDTELADIVQYTPLSAIEQILPATEQQRGMIMLQNANVNSGVYRVQTAFELAGPIDAQALQSAWLTVLNRHDMLRSEFHTSSVSDTDSDAQLDNVWRVALTRIDAERFERDVWASIDWRDVALAERENTFDQWLQERVHTDFTLSCGPLMTITLIQLNDELHRMVWQHHHAICDGWSSANVYREVFTLYQSLISGNSLQEALSALPHAPKYSEYQNYLNTLDTDASATFWAEQLATIEKGTKVTAVSTRRAVQQQTSAQVQEIEFILDTELTNALKALADREQVTLNHLCLLTWSLILQSYQGYAEPSVFGVTVSGRPEALQGVEHLVGMTLNSIPFVSPLTPEQSVSEALATIKSQMLAIGPHSLMPLNAIQQQGQVHGELFDSLIVFENVPEGLELKSAQGQLSATRLNSYSFNNYPLTWMIVPTARLYFKAKYNLARIAENDVLQLFAAWKQVLQQLTQVQHLAELSPIVELPRTLTACAPASAPLQTVPQCVAHFAEQAASQQRKTVAIDDGEQQLTYPQLQARVNQFANFLLDICGPLATDDTSPTRVGVVLPRTVDACVVMLATMQVGRSYVPFEPDVPAERLASVIEDANINVIVSSEGYHDVLMSEQLSALMSGIELISMARDAEEIADYPTEFTEETLPSISSDAYVIYTSGTTGKPKGVPISHGAIVNYSRAVVERLALADDAQMTALATVAADLGYTAVYGALLTGRTLRILPDAAQHDSQLMAQCLRDNPVSCLKIVPSHLQALLSVGDLCLPTEALVLGGEATPPELLAQIHELAPTLRIYNHYGPSEATVGVLCGEMSLADSSATDTSTVRQPSLSMGQPLSGVVALVLNATQQQVAHGVVGELYIGGRTLSRGYINREQETAARFIANPLPALADAAPRLYRSGDLVYQDDQGNFVFVGRADDQVKIRGYRVELEEVRQQLLNIEAVQNAAVLAVDGQLHAFVVAESSVDSDNPQTHSPLRAEKITAALATALPEYMLPQHWLFLESLPVTSNGKIDRSELLRLGQAHNADGSAVSAAAARNATEQALVGLWQQLLGNKTLGIHDNFFALGGDSIIAIQLVSRARQAGIILTPQLVFEQPTIAELAAVAGQQTVIEAEQGDVSGHVSLLPVQQRFFERTQVQPQHYVQAKLLCPPQGLNQQQLQAAIVTLAKHHDMLGASYQMDDHGQWQQTLRTYAQIEQDFAKPEVVQHIAAPWAAEQNPEQRHLQITQVVNEACEQASYALNLAGSPLLRVLWFDAQGNDDRLLIICHHLVVDGVSWRILLDDLVQLMNEQSLPAKSNSVREWLNRLQDSSNAERFSQQCDYWLAQQAPALPLTLAADTTEAATHLHTHAWSRELTQQLFDTQLAQLNVNAETALLAALAHAVEQEFQQAEFGIEMESHGRDIADTQVDISRTVGWFTAIYPLALSFDMGSDLMSKLKRTKQSLGEVPEQGIGFAALRYLHNTSELSALNPRIKFNYFGRVAEAVTDGDAAHWQEAPEFVTALHSEQQIKHHLLEINVAVLHGQLQLSWRYPLAHKAAFDALFARFAESVEQLITNSDAASQPILTPSDVPEAEMEQEDLDDLMSELDALF